MLRLYADCLANAKLEVILADSNQVAVVILQGTHRTTDDNQILTGCLLARPVHLQ